MYPFSVNKLARWYEVGRRALASKKTAWFELHHLQFCILHPALAEYFSFVSYLLSHGQTPFIMKGKVRDEEFIKYWPIA